MSARASARLAAALSLFAALALQPSWALINPNYTVADLVRDSGSVFVLQVHAAQGTKVTGEIVEALVGAVPSERTVTFDFADAEDLAEEVVTGAFGGRATDLAVLCVQKRKRDGLVVGAVEIGTTWMGLTHSDQAGVWKLDRDPNDLETVWGGSARRLVPAIRYAIEDPAAVFPVTAAMNWAGDVSLGKLPGKGRGCVVVEAGIVLLSEGGDRFYRSGGKDGRPVDATGDVRLASASRAMTPGDFNGDGRTDLASWNGSRVRLLPQGEGGEYGVAPGDCELTRCRSLCALGDDVVVGEDTGIALLKPGGSGGWTVRRLAGAGGVAVVADFNDDGANDIMQVSSEAVVLWAGTREPGLFADASRWSVSTVRRPAAVLCGDYDADGRLDLFVAGEGGVSLLGRDSTGTWSAVTAETGELGAASGLGQGDATVDSICPSDLNADGRQSAALFASGASPGLFFNRGFACFGLARTLSLFEAKLPAAEALGLGQSAGVLWDMNGDLVPDMLAADTEGAVWMLVGEAKSARRLQLAMLNGGAFPVTVAVAMGQRRVGMHVLRPGEPAVTGLPRPGKVTLTWRNPDGAASSRDVVVMSSSRVTIP